MSAIKNINQYGLCKFKQPFKRSELIVDKKLKIVDITKISSSFGESVIVELEENIIFLPKRMHNLMTEEAIKELLEGNGSYIIYKGEKDIPGKLLKALLYEFEKIE